MDKQICKRLEAVIRGTFTLPKGTKIEIRELSWVEGLDFPRQTRIAVQMKGEQQVFTIHKPADKIRLSDVRALETPRGAGRALTLRGHLKRLLGLFGVSAGMYAASAVCPFCGSPHCAVGLGSAGVFGALVALVVHNWKQFFYSLRARLTRLRSDVEES
jgi:hypothetical protein